jgi:peptide deformylase
MELVLYPHPILRKRAVPLKTVDASIREKAREMFAIMYREKGVGLAAPQVGWSVRIFVANPLGEEKPEGERVYINPELRLPEGKPEETADEEGCLSIPGVRGKVTRYQRVLLVARDAEGKPFEEDLSDFPARVVQHEIDHLDGILFITRLNATDRMLAGKVLKKLEREFKGPSGG